MTKGYKHDLRDEAENKTWGGCFKCVTTNQEGLLYVFVDLMVVVVSLIVLTIVIQYKTCNWEVVKFFVVFWSYVFQTLIMMVAILSAHCFYEIIDPAV